MRERATMYDTACLVWRLLGVPADKVELFGLIDPLWEDGALWVNPYVLEDEETASKVTEVLFFASKWRTFSNSRWLTMGYATRALVLSLAFGLEHWVALVRADPKASDYYLHGFSRLSPALKIIWC